MVEDEDEDDEGTVLHVDYAALQPARGGFNVKESENPKGPGAFSFMTGDVMPSPQQAREWAAMSPINRSLALLSATSTEKPKGAQTMSTSPARPADGQQEAKSRGKEPEVEHFTQLANIMAENANNKMSTQAIAMLNQTSLVQETLMFLW